MEAVTQHQPQSLPSPRSITTAALLSRKGTREPQTTARVGGQLLGTPIPPISVYEDAGVDSPSHRERQRGPASGQGEEGLWQGSPSVVLLPKSRVSGCPLLQPAPQGLLRAWHPAGCEGSSRAGLAPLLAPSSVPQDRLCPHSARPQLTHSHGASSSPVLPCSPCSSASPRPLGSAGPKMEPESPKMSFLG